MSNLPHLAVPQESSVPAPSSSPRGDRKSKNLDELFERVKASDFPLPPGGQIHCVRSTDTVKEAAAQLIKHNVLSMPVRNVEAKAGADWLESYVGLVDMIDIAAFVLDLLDESKLNNKGYAGLAEENEKIAKTLVSQIADISGSNPFVPLDSNASLRETMLLMGKHHLYRIPIIDSEKQTLVNLLTQSQVIRLLHRNIKILGAHGEKTLKDFGLGAPKKMQVVSLDSPAIIGFKLITENRIGAVPVTGVEGTLVGNLSAKDIRAIFAAPDVYQALFKSVGQFLEIAHGDKYESMVPAICCKASATLKHVLEMLTTSRIHRMYIVDDKNKLVSVVSLTDILGALVTEPAK